jgi:hypothetical protein
MAEDHFSSLMKDSARLAAPHGGIDTERLLARHPDLLEDVLVVQDTPEIVGMKIEGLVPRIKRTSYDFHAVPHDWPDADYVRMFEQVKKAFKKRYSKLLIYEIVLPKVGATNMQTTLNVEFMRYTSGLERTEVD